MNPTLRLAFSGTALLCMSPGSLAQTARVLIREGDLLGPSGHSVSAIGTPDANNVGGFATTLSTTDGAVTHSHVWGSAGPGTTGSLLRSESLGISGFDQTAFANSFGLDDSGAVAYSPLVNDLTTMLVGLDGLWVDSTPILNQGENPITEPLLLSRSNDRANIIKSTGEPVWLAGLNNAAAIDAGQRLYRGAGHTIVQRTGVPAPAPLAANLTGIGNDFRFSALGTHFISEIDTDLTPGLDNFMTIDGALAMTSAMTIIGQGVALPGATESWESFDSFGINETGDFMFTGETDGPVSTDEVIVYNGDVILREGDSVIDAGGVLYTVTGNIDFGAMNEQGDIAVVWDLDVAGNEAVLVNGVVALKVGDEVDWDNDGALDAGHTVATSGFVGVVAIAISPRIGGAVRAYVTADIEVPVAGPVQGLICIEVPVSGSYPDLCSGDGGNQAGCTNCPCSNNAAAGTIGGCLNSAGTATRLEGSGLASVSLVPGVSHDLRFGLSGAPANAFCILNSGDAIAPANMIHPCFGMNSGGQAAVFDGLRCAIMNTRRHGGRSADSGGVVGEGAMSQPWGGEGGPPVGIAQAGAGFVAGQTRYFQVIHRDDETLVCLRGLNTSQAVEVTFAP